MILSPWAAANQFLVSRPTLIAVAQSTEAFGIVRGTERERDWREVHEREREALLSVAAKERPRRNSVIAFWIGSAALGV